MNQVAVTASARGRFVSAEHNEWDGFTGRDGQPVKGGETLNIHVLAGTGESEQVVKIWTATDDISRALHAVDGLKFGDQVEFIVQPGAKKSYRFIDRVMPAKVV